ncbi:MAG: aromatic-ring-hydroxylating dioxygenase subunit beta [Actinobacteria bacterium]|nr:aromatic-ring-hydroxylating dioxygenase subunit beta [Actinomycetota bacterium]
MTAEEILYREAALLDAGRFDEWLELFTDDAVYWIPQGEGGDPEHEVSIVYDDRRRMHERVLRLGSGFAYSQDPPSRTCHLVGNVLVEPGEGEGELRVGSKLIVAEVRRNAQNLFAGAVEHVLVPDGEGLRIRRKVVRLVNSDIPLGNVTFLI